MNGLISPGSFSIFGHKRSKKDFYQSPHHAIEDLINHIYEPLTQDVFDAGAGDGRLWRPLAENGYNVTGWDEVKRCDDLPIQMTSFEDVKAVKGDVVTNPPYSNVDPFIHHALSIVPEDGKVCALLRLNWMCALSRRDIVHNHLKQIIIVGRYGMPPPGVVCDKDTGGVDYAWFVMTPRKVDATIITRTPRYG